MLTDMRKRVAAAVQAAVAATTGKQIDEPPVERPPRPEFGDLAVPAALQLARELGRPPRDVAQQILEHLEQRPVDGISRWTIAGPGYLNAFLDRGYVFAGVLDSLEAEQRPGSQEKVIVEHTSINPNKAAHIGHLRNACLGDTLVRVLRFMGATVEIQNYIDDTGVQVADVVLGLVDMEQLDAQQVAELPEPFDYYCWDLYTETTRKLQDDEALQGRRRQVLLALESDAGLEAEVGRKVVDRISRRHLKTMARLDIRYDVLIRESDVVRADLWTEAFEKLKRTKQVYFAEDGKHAGCWMMRLESVPGFEALQEADKVLVRSNGTATYVAKDIAYHMWKYGLLERGFHYRPFAGGNGSQVTWRSATDDGETRPFGGAARTVNVIDVRQAYLQSIVGLALAACGAEGHTHFDYEFVALTPRTAIELGIPVSEEQQQKAYVEMSGRRGYGVKADDLLDALEKHAAREVAERNPELPTDERAELARQIAVAAVRYFLVKFTRKTVIAFDLDEALSFEGETGPYLQYAVVRAAKIFEKMRQRWGLTEAGAVAHGYAAAGDGLEADGRLSGVWSGKVAIRAADGQDNGRAGPGGGAGEAATAAERIAALQVHDLRRLLEDDEGPLWSFVLTLGAFEEAVALAAETLELSGLAKYAFGLAQEFNHVYHRYPILQEEDHEARALRILITHAFRVRLRQALDLLGIPVPQRM